MGSWRIREDTLLVMDISDIAKKYAQKMEYMARVWDGSEGEVANGYWTCNVIGAEVGEVALTPLYSRLFSQAGPDFRSENAEICKAISIVSKHTEKRGIWVLDRGGDSREIIDHLLDEELGLIIRSKGDRHLIYRGRKDSVYNLALRCPLFYRERVIREEGKKEKIYFLEFGSRSVKLLGREERLYLVVVRGFGQEPMMLLTNQRVKKSRKSLWRIIELYITRWRIGVSSEGRMTQPVGVRPRLKDSRPCSLGGAVEREQDGEALRQHSLKGGCATLQVVTCSERGCSLVTRMNPVAEPVDNVRRQQEVTG